MSSSVTEQWGWMDAPYAQQEDFILRFHHKVAEMLQTPSLLCSNQATKDAVLRQISQVECIHFATHVSWKLSAIVLAPSSTSSGELVTAVASSAADQGDASATPLSSVGMSASSMGSMASLNKNDRLQVAPDQRDLLLSALSEFLLTAADILNLRLSARLVVVSSVHTRDHHGIAHSDSVVGLSRALLAAVRPRLPMASTRYGCQNFHAYLLLFSAAGT